MIRSLTLTIIYSFLFFLSSNVSAIEQFDIISIVDTSYLPYKSIEVDSFDLQERDAFTLEIPVKVLEPSIEHISIGTLINAINEEKTNADATRFSTRSYPSRKLIDDDPISFIISDWTTWISPSDSMKYVIGICHDTDSLMLFKFDIDNDKVAYKKFYDIPGSNLKLNPYVEIYHISENAKDESSDIIFYIQYGRDVRKIYSADINILGLSWEHSIAAGLSNQSVFVQQNKNVILATICPANNMSDSNYIDFYSYLSIIDNNGRLIHNKIIGYFAKFGPYLNRINDSLFYLLHTLPFQKPNEGDTLAYQCYISVINDKGEVLNTINGPDNVSRCWSIPTTLHKKPVLFVTTKSSAINIYDTQLNQIASSSYENSGYIYLTRIKISGEEDSVYVFNDGFYDIDFKKIMQFQFKCYNFQILMYDSLGNTIDYIISKPNLSFIGRIHQKSSIELLSVFYHNNQVYVLMLLSGLFVSLISISVYQRKTKSNLNLIAIQKSDLEKTHQKLKDTQLKLIEAEKYKQAKDIAGGFAHEIRNALFPVDGSLNKLFKINKPEQYDQERFENYFEKIRTSTNRAISMTELISQYTKLDSEYIPEKVIIFKILNEVIEANQSRIDDQNVEMKIEGNTDSSIKSNNQQLFIVFNNLLLNSLDALTNRDNCLIFIKWWVAKGNLNLFFEDNGAGIGSDDIDKIFNTFFSTKPTKGTGIGLSMTKKIVEMYSGTISVSSKEHNKTTFEIIFKLSAT